MLVGGGEDFEGVVDILREVIFLGREGGGIGKVVRVGRRCGCPSCGGGGGGGVGRFW